MKTEEAIESVKMAYCAWESEQKDMYEVIELLEQGEKYEKLISQLKELYDAEMPITKVLTPYKMIEYLEQRYFPKELPDEKTTKL